MSPKGVVLALVALALGVVSGVVIGGVRAGGPSDLGVDAGFARDMQTHHDQAVEMSLVVRDRTDDPAVRSLAYDIARTQSHQSGQMAGWLQSWGLSPTSSQPVMAWMGHEHAGGSGAMPGMASAADLTKLEGLRGRAAEIWYLQLMIRHHEGGVPMAQAAAERADRPEVVRLARSIITSQRAETETMTQMLRERGAEPLG